MKRSMSILCAAATLLYLTCLACNSGATDVAEKQADVKTQPVAANHSQPASKPEPKPVEPPVSDAKAPEPELDPDQYDLDEPIPAGALYDAFYADQTAWLGKKVTVVGYYKGSTHSSATDETRVDLKTGPLGKTVVGCMIPGKNITPRSAVDQRAGVIMRGTIVKPFFGQVILREVVFVNRE